MSLSVPSELTSPVLLCTKSGQLNPAARGWAKHPLYRCNLVGPMFRRKRWNFACVATQDLLFAVAISDADYVGLVFAWMYDFRTGELRDMEQLQPLARGVKLGESFSDEAEFSGGGVSMHWKPQRVGSDAAQPSAIELQLHCPNFGGEKLTAELQIQLPRSDESLNLVVPWSDARFGFTSKHVCLPTHGFITVGEKTRTLVAEQALGSIDFSRGVWPYNSRWHWASGSGYAGGRRVGLNLGAGWTDGTGVVENAIFLDGHVVPLWEQVQFLFDPVNLRGLWRIQSPESQNVRLTFTPAQSRTQDTNLGILRTKLDQVIGHFSGRVILPSGEELLIEDLPGIAENHIARF